MLAFLCCALFVSAQSYTLDDARDDATEIVSQSSQINGKVSSLINMMSQKKTNSKQLESRLADLDQSFSALVTQAASMNSGIGSLNNRVNTYETLTASSSILIRHLMLVADDKSSFSSRGDEESGNNLSSGLQELKRLAQDIRAEVMAMKNSSN